MKWFVLALRVALAAVFLYAGIVKASASEEFALALVPFTFVPAGWTGALAILLACTEILAGILLLVPRVYPLGALITLFLACLFIVVLAWALANGIIVDCGCFGKDEAPSAGKMIESIVRDVLIALAAAWILVCSFRERTSHSSGTPTRR